MVYVVLNTVIWLVVKSTGGRVVPSNYNEKEVYDWGLGGGLPGWMKFLKGKMIPSRFQSSERKSAVELVDNDSAMNAARESSSRGNPAEDKDIHVLHDPTFLHNPTHLHSPAQHTSGRRGALPSLD